MESKCWTIGERKDDFPKDFLVNLNNGIFVLDRESDCKWAAAAVVS